MKYLSNALKKIYMKFYNLEDCPKEKLTRLFQHSVRLLLLYWSQAYYKNLVFFSNNHSVANKRFSVGRSMS